MAAAAAADRRDRVEQVAERARRLLQELSAGTRPPPSPALAEHPGAGGAAPSAALQLAEAADPLWAEPALGGAAEPICSWCPAARSGGWLRVAVGAVRLAPRLGQRVLASQVALLRCVVPATSSRAGSRSARVAEDVVVVCCRDVGADGTELDFGRASVHDLRLAAETLPALAARPLRLQLMLQDAGLETELVGEADLLWHQALLAPEGRSIRCEPSLLAPAPEGRGGAPRTADIGTVEVTITLYNCDASAAPTAPTHAPSSRAAASPPAAVAPEPAGPAGGAKAAAPRGIYLRVSLGWLRLRMPSLCGLRAVLKLGPMQELSAEATEDPPELRVPGTVEAEGTLGASTVSARAVWLVDADTGEAVEGPRPESLYAQLMRGAEIVGLLRRLPLQALTPALSRRLAAGGEYELLFDSSVEVLSSTTGAPMGTAHVTLHAGTSGALGQVPSARASKLPGACRALAPSASLEREAATRGSGAVARPPGRPLRATSAPGCGLQGGGRLPATPRVAASAHGGRPRLPPTFPPRRPLREAARLAGGAAARPAACGWRQDCWSGGGAQSRWGPGTARATLELEQPIDSPGLVAAFSLQLVTSAAEVLGLSPGRLRVLLAEPGSRLVELEVVAGPPGEDGPEAATRALGAQLEDTCSELLRGPLAPLLQGATLRRRRAGPPPRRPPRAAGPGPSARDGWCWDSGCTLECRLFGVVRESGVGAERAFAILDGDGDGMASLDDVAAVLREVGLPPGDAELADAAAGAWATRRSVPELVWQYREWLDLGKWSG